MLEKEAKRLKIIKISVKIYSQFEKNKHSKIYQNNQVYKSNQKKIQPNKKRKV